MQILRNSHRIALLVLVWFALSLGVAVASPIVNPQSSTLICSSDGVMKLMAMSDDGVAELAGVMGHCPLCVVGGAPPPSFKINFEPYAPQRYVSQSIPSPVVAVRTAAPLFARGPPTQV